MLPNEKNIGILCHDAGAANIIIAWLNKKNVSKYQISMSGPAKKIFKEKFIISKLKNNIFDLKRPIKKLIVGTGWQTSFEFNAIRAAKNQNIYCIAVIDHWVNYRKRFMRNNKTVLPDEIWVTDKFAKMKAKKIFLSTPIFLKKNFYLSEQINKIEKYKSSKKNSNIFLFLSEPIRNKKGKLTNLEFKSLSFLFKNINMFKSSKKFHLVIRPHPSENIGKYSEFIKRFSESQSISIDSDTKLYKLIGSADIVFGCQSYSLIIAKNLEKSLQLSSP